MVEETRVKWKNAALRTLAGGLVCGIGMAAALLCSAEAAPVTVYLGGERLILPTVRVRDAEYLSLKSLTRATGQSPTRLRTRGSVHIQLGNSSLVLTVGSPEVRIRNSIVMLSESPRRLGESVVVPLELVPIALSARYGENRIDWDPEMRIARVTDKAYSLRLLRFRTYPDYTRVVLEGTRPHEFIVGEDGASGRVVLEVKQGIMSPSMRSIQVSDGLVAAIDARQLRHDAQITIHGAGRPLWSKIFALEGPDRIVVDLFPREPREDLSLQADNGTKTTPRRTVQSKPVARSGEPREPSEVMVPEQIIKTIVIDPGHGGRDSGAIGRSGAKEKDIVLDIGLRLQQLIEETLGIKVVMTRTEDVFVPLESRTSACT
jgi:N-acetylmuramoyl-L-alanine amidase